MDSKHRTAGKAGITRGEIFSAPIPTTTAKSHPMNGKAGAAHSTGSIKITMESLRGTKRGMGAVVSVSIEVKPEKLSAEWTRTTMVKFREMNGAGLQKRLTGLTATMTGY